MKSMAWDDALWGLAALAVDPSGVKGIWLKSFHGPLTDEWLNWLRAIRSDTVKIPCNIDSERLLGGLDLASTLQMGRPIKQSGVLAQSNGKVLICPMSERLSQSTASILTQVLDSGQVSSQFGHTHESARFGFVAIDESTPEEDSISNSLSEQLGIWIDLTMLNPRQNAEDETLDMLERVEKALRENPHAFKENIKKIKISENTIGDLCELAQGFSISSMRAPWYAARLAAILAVLRGAPAIEADDLGRAARLVLTPRARTMPSQVEEQSADSDTADQQLPPPTNSADEAENEPTSQPDELKDDSSFEDKHSSEPSPSEQTNNSQKGDSHLSDDSNTAEIQKLETTILEAALATLPHGLLKQLAEGRSISKKGAAGRAGDIQKGSQKGRPLPAVKGLPQNGHRLHVLATLRHAAPRQKIREMSGQNIASNHFINQNSNQIKRLKILSEDFHIQKFAKRSESCIIFCIDASGSAALERLAEAKGAIELLLKESYARRDHICVIGFRDKVAQVHLPATRSLVRAKRELQALPGGGGTPLASAIRLALQTSIQAKQRGMSPTLVILSDGRANVTLEGEGSRPIAKTQALSWAKQWRATQLQCIWLDTSARPDQQAQEVSSAMGANYVPLPLANSQRMAQAVNNIKDLGS